jgi:hypothetical protein
MNQTHRDVRVDEIDLAFRGAVEGSTKGVLIELDV